MTSRAVLLHHRRVPGPENPALAGNDEGQRHGHRCQGLSWAALAVAHVRSEAAAWLSEIKKVSLPPARKLWAMSPVQQPESSSRSQALASSGDGSCSELAGMGQAWGSAWAQSLLSLSRRWWPVTELFVRGGGDTYKELQCPGLWTGTSGILPPHLKTSP